MCVGEARETGQQPKQHFYEEVEIMVCLPDNRIKLIWSDSVPLTKYNCSYTCYLKVILTYYDTIQNIMTYEFHSKYYRFPPMITGGFYPKLHLPNFYY